MLKKLFSNAPKCYVYYAIDSYTHYSILCFIKIHTTQVHAVEFTVLVHRPFTLLSPLVYNHFLFSTQFGRKRHVSHDLN